MMFPLSQSQAAVEQAEAEAQLWLLVNRDIQPSVKAELDRRVALGMTRLAATRSVRDDLVLGRWSPRANVKHSGTGSW